MEELLTPEQVASLLRVHKRTIQRYIAEGRLQAYRVSRGVQRIRKEDVEEFLEGLKTLSNLRH